MSPKTSTSTFITTYVDYKTILWGLTNLNKCIETYQNNVAMYQTKNMNTNQKPKSIHLNHKQILVEYNSVGESFYCSWAQVELKIHLCIQLNHEQNFVEWNSV